MVFEEKSKGLIIKRYIDTGMDRHVYLDGKRATQLATVKKVYEHDVLKKLSYNCLVKIAIDSLMESLEDLSEEEAIEYLKDHHIKVFF